MSNTVLKVMKLFAPKHRGSRHEHKPLAASYNRKTLVMFK